MDIKIVSAAVDIYKEISDMFVLSRMDAAVSRAVYLLRHLSKLLLSPTRITVHAINGHVSNFNGRRFKSKKLNDLTLKLDYSYEGIHFHNVYVSIRFIDKKHPLVDL